MFELQTRGGISMVTKKFARANNPYIPKTFDKNKPRKYLMYLDANNLYGYAMSQPLPTGFMRFLDDEEIQNFQYDGRTERCRERICSTSKFGVSPSLT